MNPLIIENFVIRTDDAGRYSLNDLHVAAGSQPRHQPSNWLRLEQTQELITEIDRCSDLSNAIISVDSSDLRNQSVASKQGIGTYVCRELVYAYAMWVSAVFQLRVIRAYDGQQKYKKLSVDASDVFLAASELKKHLSLPQSGYIDVLQRGMRVVAPELLPMLPSYSIDTSPVGLVTTGSSKPTFALTTLLKRHNLPYSAVGFNRLLVSAGVLIDMTRPSTTRGTKSYKAISDDWLHYGKNVVSPTNPRETQPHWYDGTFPELVAKVTQ